MDRKIASPNLFLPRPGAVVGCRYRWPYDACHPDCWQPPSKGVVLALNDPVAWAGRAAFGYRPDPSQTEVDAHVEWCLSQGVLNDHVPVFYTTDEGKTFVQWDTKLSPYEEEFAVWKAERDRRLDEEACRKAERRGLKLVG